MFHNCIVMKNVESLLLCEADMESYKSFRGLVPLVAIKN